MSLMVLALNTLFLAGAAVPLPYAFLDPGKLSHAQGIELRAQLPQETETLIEPDASKPSLWYSPGGAAETNQGIMAWYQRVNKQEIEYSDQRTLCVLLYDGEKWRRPDIGETPPAWGGPDNVVLRRSPHTPTWGGFNVFQIVPQGDGFAALYWDQPETGDAGAMLAYSEDGLHWEKDPRGTVFTEHNDAFSLLAKDDGFYLYQTKLIDWPEKPVEDNLPGKRRVQSLRKSADLIHWTGQEVMLVPDADDPEGLEFYLLTVFPHSSLYLGVLLKYMGDPGNPGRHSGIMPSELIVSDDAVHWKRPFRGTDLGFWSYVKPFPYRGLLAIPAHKDGGLVLQLYHPNRFSAAIAGSTPGEFVTPLLVMTDVGLALDADAHDGWIEVSLLDKDGKPVEGAQVVRLEGVEGHSLPLDWGNIGLDPHNLVECRLRLRLMNARIYAIAAAGTGG